MRRSVASVTGNGNSSAVIPIDHRAVTLGFAFYVTVSGTITYKVQHTYDDIQSATFDPSSATWFDHGTVTGKTAAAEGTYSQNPTGVRVTATAGTGSATLTVLQPTPV